MNDTSLSSFHVDFTQMHVPLFDHQIMHMHLLINRCKHWKWSMYIDAVVNHSDTNHSHDTHVQKDESTSHSH